MPITIGFFSWERIKHFPFISYGKNSFGIRPVWCKSKNLERIKDVYRGTTVWECSIAPVALRKAPTTVYAKTHSRKQHNRIFIFVPT
jgi:hypothetical protein